MGNRYLEQTGVINARRGRPRYNWLEGLALFLQNDCEIHSARTVGVGLHEVCMTQWQPTVKKLGHDPALLPVQDEREYLRKGRVLFREGHYDEARAEFEALQANNPQSASARIGIGMVFWRQDDLEKALACFTEARTLDPLLPKAYVLEGQALTELGRFEPAMLAFQSALNLDPKSTKAMTGLGQALARQQRYEEALILLQTALRYDPRKAQPRLLIAGIYRDCGQPDAAMAELRRALEFRPDHVRAAILLARLQVASGARDAAESLLRNVLTRLTEDHSAIAQLGRAALELELYPFAEEALREALHRDPDRTSTRLRLVEALLANGKVEDAARHAQELPQNNQIAPLVHKLLGDIHYQRQQFQSAVEEYRATVLHLPGHEQLLSELEQELAASDNAWEELAEGFQPVIANQVTDETRRLRQNRRNRHRRA